jgi:hypothetical protein
MLCRDRWLAELDIRAVKTTLDMDVPRCKTPEMVRRELGWSNKPVLVTVHISPPSSLR